jgi:hypothetical protein
MGHTAWIITAPKTFFITCIYARKAMLCAGSVASGLIVVGGIAIEA